MDADQKEALVETRKRAHDDCGLTQAEKNTVLLQANDDLEAIRECANKVVIEIIDDMANKRKRADNVAIVEEQDKNTGNDSPITSRVDEEKEKEEEELSSEEQINLEHAMLYELKWADGGIRSSGIGDCVGICRTRRLLYEAVPVGSECADGAIIQFLYTLQRDGDEVLMYIMGPRDPQKATLADVRLLGAILAQDNDGKARRLTYAVLTHLLLPQHFVEKWSPTTTMEDRKPWREMACKTYKKYVGIDFDATKHSEWARYADPDKFQRLHPRAVLRFARM